MPFYPVETDRGLIHIPDTGLNLHGDFTGTVLYKSGIQPRGKTSMN